MNCHAAQRKITDAFAGETVVPPEVTAHRETCVECQAYGEKQRQLFASIDAGLRTKVNPPVPLSFFLRLRAALDEAPEPRPLSIPRWTYAAVAATLVLALTAVAFRNRFLRQDASSEPSHVVARSDPQPAPESPPISSAVASRRATPMRSNKKASPVPTEPPEAMPEVIVLVEEHEAFARFISHVPSNAGLGPAPKSDVPGLTDAAIDIALIEIQDVEIMPLESMNGDGR